MMNPEPFCLTALLLTWATACAQPRRAIKANSGMGVYQPQPYVQLLTRC